jgi:hypothetical protein
VERSETSEKKQKFLSRVEDHPGFPNNAVKICVTSYFMYGVSHEGKYCTFNKILVRKAQISVESSLVYQSVSQKSILCVNFMSFREWSAAKRAKRNKNFYHEWKITRAFPTTHVSTYFFHKPTTFTIANS